MKFIKNHLVLLLIFALILSGTFVSNVDTKTVQAATSDDLPSEVWETSEDLTLNSSESPEGTSLTISKSQIYLLASSGVKYDTKKKKWIAFHKIKTLTGGKPSSVKTTLKIIKKPSKGSKTSTYHTRSHTFKGASLRSGAIYEYEIPKSTGFYKKELTISMTSGVNKASKVVPDKKYSLFNNKLAKFPNYTDKWSKKVASTIRTDWAKEKKYKRAKTATIRKQYEKKYKVKPKWDKDKIELHHIRPVAYGGNSKLGNYQAIPKANHAKITTWFANY